MTEWYLWDGECQRGPMDRSELGARIRYYPDPGLIRVWRNGFPDWKTVEQAFDVAHKTPPAPPAFNPPGKSSEKSKYRNFIARNWRGDYPLWVSYWVIGVLSNVFAVVAAVLIKAFATTKGTYNPIGILTFYVLLWSVVVALSTWHLVGIWRSAQRRIAERRATGKRALWASLAKVAVCMGCLQIGGILIRSGIPQMWEASRIAFMDDPNIPSYSIRVMNNGSEAEITGGIKFGLSRDFEKVLDATTGVRVVHLDSIGGRVGEGQKLNALIKSRGLDTYVDAKCLSACTLAYAAGRQRILKRGGQLGFHRGAFAGEDDLSSESERSIYAAAGIGSAFIDRALATRNAEMWRPSEAELLSAGVVTQISNGDEFAMAGYGGTKFTRDDWDKALQKAGPVYQTLKERYPKSYAEILDTFSEGAAKGTPKAELTAKARRKLFGVIKVLLPYADDAVLIEFGQLVAEQYRALQTRDKMACYKFASGQSDEAVVRMIPAPLTERELKLDALVLSSAKARQNAGSTGPSWNKIRAGLTSKGYSSGDLRLLQDKGPAPSEYSRYCDLAVTLYQEIANLPANEAASVLRELFS